MPKVIVLFGKPGAGKGTRMSEFLATTSKKFNILSVGNLLRQARADNTELGQKAATFMDNGFLVPDDIINEIVIEGIKKSEFPIISDGFPRTRGQALAMLDAGIKPVVINFEVDDNVVIQRAKDRLICKNCGEPYTTNNFKPPLVEGVCDKCGGPLHRRHDDNPEVVEHRLRVYKSETLPVLELLLNYNVEVYTIDNSNPETAKNQFAEIMNR